MSNKKNRTSNDEVDGVSHADFFEPRALPEVGMTLGEYLDELEYERQRGSRRNTGLKRF